MKIDSKQVIGGIIILAIGAALLFGGDAKAEQDKFDTPAPAAATLNLEGMEYLHFVLGVHHFSLPSLVDDEMLCAPQGDGIVWCIVKEVKYTCTYEEPPVYFTDCKEIDEQVPAAESVIIEPSV